MRVNPCKRSVGSYLLGMCHVLGHCTQLITSQLKLLSSLEVLFDVLETDSNLSMLFRGRIRSKR